MECVTDQIQRKCDLREQAAMMQRKQNQIHDNGDGFDKEQDRVN